MSPKSEKRSVSFTAVDFSACGVAGLEAEGAFGEAAGAGFLVTWAMGGARFGGGGRGGAGTGKGAGGGGGATRVGASKTEGAAPRAGGGGRVGGGGSGPGFSSSFTPVFFTINMCWHFEQRTRTPVAVTFSSAILKRLEHLEHWTIMSFPFMNHPSLYPGDQDLALSSRSQRRTHDG